MNTNNLTMEEHFQLLREKLLTQDNDESIEYTLSKKYIEDYLKSSNLYLGCSEQKRKRLIEVDLYRLQKAFEDGFKAAVELYKQNNHEQIS
jgi:hypothetical protein